MQLQSPQNAGWKRPGNRRQHQRNICLCIGDAIFCDKPILVRERRSGAVIFGHGNIIHYWEDVTRHNRVSFGSTCQTSAGSRPAPIRGEYCDHVTCSPPITAHLVALVHHQPDGVRQAGARAAGVPARVNNIDLGLDLDTTYIFIRSQNIFISIPSKYFLFTSCHLGIPVSGLRDHEVWVDFFDSPDEVNHVGPSSLHAAKIGLISQQQPQDIHLLAAGALLQVEVDAVDTVVVTPPRHLSW